MPELVRGVANRLWGLSDSSREDCVLLAHALSLPTSGPPILTSDERKARETAEVLALRLGRDTVIDPRLSEVDRPTTWDDDYRALAAAYIGGQHQDGWESRDAVLSRFTAGCDAAIAIAHGADIVVVNHGLALSIYLQSRLELDIIPFWRALTLPDAWALDLETLELTHVFDAGMAPPDA